MTQNGFSWTVFSASLHDWWHVHGPAIVHNSGIAAGITLGLYVLLTLLGPKKGRS